jgi:hypothetical protein
MKILSINYLNNATRVISNLTYEIEDGTIWSQTRIVLDFSLHLSIYVLTKTEYLRSVQ